MTYTNSVHRNLSHYRICHCPQNTASGARSAPATRALSNEKPVLPYVWLKLEFDWSEAAFFAVSVARRRCKPHHEEQRISDQIWLNEYELHAVLLSKLTNYGVVLLRGHS